MRAPFVDHRKDRALDDLLRRDRAAGDAEPGRGVENDALDLGVGDRGARAGLVAEVPAAGLLAEMPGLAQRVLDLGMLAAALADQPADIEPGQVHHRKRPHRQPEFDERGFDLLRQCPFEQQPFGLDRAARQHPVADKSVTDADHGRHLAEPPSQGQCRGDRIRRAGGAADDLQEAHDVGRAEKMRAHHVLGPGCRAGDLVDIESRGVGGEQRARFRRAVEIGEDAFFEPHFLEHRFDHDIGAPDCVDTDGAGDQAHAAVHLVGG